MKTENGKLKKYKLGEIANYIGSGMTPLRSNAMYWNSKDIPWLKTEQLGNYKIFDTNEYVSKLAVEENNLKIFPKNTLSIAMYGEGKTRGNVSVLASEMTTNQACCNVIINGKIADYEYVYYWLKNSYYKLRSLSSGIRKNLNSDDIRNFEISLPPLESQQKIAAVLSSLDDKIALNRRMNAKLEQMAKRLYDHWFVQFDFPNAAGKPYKASGSKMVWNETLKREIPDGWEVKKLGELFTTNRGVSYSTKTITGEIGIPMINLASFSPDGSYKIDGIKVYTGEYTQEKVLKPFDLVMCNTQQTAIDFSKDIIGKALLVPDIFEGDITSSHHVNTLKVQNEKLKFYLYRLFNTDYFHAYISHYASGTNIMGLDFAGVENYTAVIPGDEILSNFADFTLNIEKKKSEIIRENTKLIALRDRLLPLLMNGQVEV